MTGPRTTTDRSSVGDMGHWQLTGNGGEHIEVGYSTSMEGYWFAVYVGDGERPVLTSKVGECPTVLDLMTASQGEIPWPRLRGLIKELALAPLFEQVANAAPHQARVAQSLAIAIT